MLQDTHVGRPHVNAVHNMSLCVCRSTARSGLLSSMAIQLYEKADLASRELAIREPDNEEARSARLAEVWHGWHFLDISCESLCKVAKCSRCDTETRQSFFDFCRRRCWSRS